MTLTLRPRDLDLSFQQKINRIIQLWQKYNVFDQELIDSLNRIAATASIDSVLNGSAANVSLNDSATTTLSAPPPPPPPTSSSKNKKRSGEEAAKHVKKGNKQLTEAKDIAEKGFGAKCLKYLIIINLVLLFFVILKYSLRH